MSIVDTVVTYEAQLTQKSLSNQAAYCLVIVANLRHQPDHDWNLFENLCEIPSCVDSNGKYHICSLILCKIQSFQ